MLLAGLAPQTLAQQAEPPPAPQDPSGGRPAARVLVAKGGMQQIEAAALISAGLDPAQASRLQLWHAGSPVALEQRGGGEQLELRFFAPPPGDRWNATDTYWLTLEAGPVLRMTTRSVIPRPAPDEAPQRAAALEEGIWRKPALYDSTTPGPTGDHWFAADLRTGPGLPAQELAVGFSPWLPTAGGPMTLTIVGAAATIGAHTLEIRAGAEVQRTSWSGSGSFRHQVGFAAGATGAVLALVPETVPDNLLIQHVEWERAAALNLSGKGGMFLGVPGRWRYELSSVPTNAVLYDVSDPPRPVALLWSGEHFEDEGSRSYLVVGADDLRRPQVVRYDGLNLPVPAEAIYIGPVAFHAALAPLVAHRRAQGLGVAVVDVQTLYDAWSQGQVDPEAIRSFLRYAAANWHVQPRAVTLVGDGTSDPRGYSDRQVTNFVPPYLAMVDPWLGETACEPCYGQLNGQHPLDDETQDLAVGRLPVKSGAELAAVVAKIVAYETTPGGLPWRSRAVLVTDNGYEADGAPDPAGDFAHFADEAARLLPVGVIATKIYYDPWGRDFAGSPRLEGWREPDASTARARVRAALGAGAGLVIYAGHASQWEWARTGPPLPEGERYLLGLYDPDTMPNSGQLPVVLAMTCMTSAFHQPAFSGTTLDERMVLSPAGGAVAVWGPTGLGVSHGHDALLRGFLASLRAAPVGASLGELTLAGYAELRADRALQGARARSSLWTFALLGDPLTPVRVAGVSRAALPIVRR